MVASTEWGRSELASPQLICTPRTIWIHHKAKPTLHRKVGFDGINAVELTRHSDLSSLGNQCNQNLYQICIR